MKINPDKSTNNDYLKYVLNASALYGALQRLTEARELLEKTLAAVGTNVTNIRILTSFKINLSLLSRQENRYASAITNLREALQNLSTMQQLSTDEGVNALLTLAEIYVDLWDPNSAETLADRAIEIAKASKQALQDNPAFLRAYAILGSVLAIRGNGVAATSALEFAFQQHAETISAADLAYIKYGYALLDTYLLLGLSAQATEFSTTLQKQISFAADDKNAAPLLARVCAAQRLGKQLELALDSCQRAATLLQTSDQTTLPAVRVALELSQTYFELGRFKDALTVATRVLQEI